jgi:hypothetical protein
MWLVVFSVSERVREWKGERDRQAETQRVQRVFTDPTLLLPTNQAHAPAHMAHSMDGLYRDIQVSKDDGFIHFERGWYFRGAGARGGAKTRNSPPPPPPSQSNNQTIKQSNNQTITHSGAPLGAHSKVSWSSSSISISIAPARVVLIGPVGPPPPRLQRCSHDGMLRP